MKLRSVLPFLFATTGMIFGAPGEPPTEVVAFDAATVTAAFAAGTTMLANERYIGRARINGGPEHSLTKGSIIVIPKGTPHWFSDVEGPLLYYVVKVSE